MMIILPCSQFLGDHKEGYHVKLRINGKHIHMELDTGCCIRSACDIRTVEQIISEYPTREIYWKSTTKLLRLAAASKRTKGSRSTIWGAVIKTTHSGDWVPQKTSFTGMRLVSHLKLDWIQLHRLLCRLTRIDYQSAVKCFKKEVGTIVRYWTDIKLKESARPVFKEFRSVVCAF